MGFYSFRIIYNVLLRVAFVITLFFCFSFIYSSFAMNLPVEYTEALNQIDRGNREAAKNLLNQLIQKFSDNGFFYLEYAINCIYLECKDNEIEEAFLKAEKLIGESPRLYFYKGLYLEGKDKKEALKLYDKAISIRPGYSDAVMRACAMYAEMGDFVSAVSYYDAIPVVKRNSTLILRMVDFFIESKDYKRASEGLNELVRRQPQNEIYLEKLRDFYEKVGDIKNATEVLAKLKRLNPQKKKTMRPLR